MNAVILINTTKLPTTTFLTTKLLDLLIQWKPLIWDASGTGIFVYYSRCLISVVHITILISVNWSQIVYYYYRYISFCIYLNCNFQNYLPTIFSETFLGWCLSFSTAMHKKFWSRARVNVLLLDRPQKILINLYDKCLKLRLARPQIQTMRLAVWNESCRAEKKHPHFHITLAYCKCNKNLLSVW